MLTLEAVFTALLSYLLYREQIDRRVGMAIVLLTLGGVSLVLDRAISGGTQVAGLLAVVAATIAWGIDNTLSRGLAHLDPGRVIWGKATLGAIGSLLIAWISGQVSVPLLIAAEIFLIGAIGYGLSLRFYLLAQRSFGSARTGSVFAAAPFVGALIAFALGERGFSWWLTGGATLMASGVVLHVLEQHEHQHGHDDLEHEHAHTHDDGHHAHLHSPMPIGAHSHVHRHRVNAD